MEQIVQQYIQAKGLNEQQAQQLIQELQQLDEQQLQQVVENMQKQLQGNNQQGGVMQYGGKKSYEKWKLSLPKNLQDTDTTLYNLRGAYEGGLVPEMSEDGFYHLGSRNPKTGELLKKKNHPTFYKMIEGEKQAGYEIYEKNGKLYSRPKLNHQYGGIPVSMDGVFEYPNQPVIVPTNNTGEISMENVNSELYGVSKFGIKKMIPNKKYNFNDDKILEFPANYVESKTNNGSMILNHKDINEEFINELKKRGYYVKIIS